MKIEVVIHSSDSNPMYLDFWPLVSKVWNIRFGLRPLLVYVDENHDIPIDTTYGDVIKMKPVHDVPIYLQCQWVRFWITTQFPDKICMTSDIDMFPISTYYFVGMIRDIPNNRYVHLNSSVDYLPVCYHVAKGSLFKQVLGLHDSWEESIRHLYDQNLGHDCSVDDPTNTVLVGKPNWGADESYTTKRITEYFDQSIFALIRRRHARIDRADWAWSKRRVDEDFYADSHSIRPYRDPKNRERIDTLVEHLTRRPRTFQSILHKFT